MVRLLPIYAIDSGLTMVMVVSCCVCSAVVICGSRKEVVPTSVIIEAVVSLF